MADQRPTELHIFRNTNHIKCTKKGTLKSGMWFYKKLKLTHSLPAI